MDPTFHSCRGAPHMVGVGTQYSDGISCYPQRSTHSVIYRCIEHWLGIILGHVDSLQCLVLTRENLPHQCVKAMLHWLRQLRGLTVLVASDNSTVVSYINKQVYITVQADQTATAHVSERGHSIVGVSHSWEVECPHRCPVTTNSDIMDRVVLMSFCFPVQYK